MKKTIKPWGWELIIEKNKDYVLKKLFMLKGESCSLQYHEKKHETIYVLSGVLKITHGVSQDDLEFVILNADDTFVCEPGHIHRMTGEEDCFYLEASTPEMNDVIRLKDNYGRADEV